MQFLKHQCGLDLGSDSMLPKSKSMSGEICRTFTKLGQISEHHPLTFEYYRSYSRMVAERQRLLLEEGGRVIHPFSLFSLFWTSLMTLVNLCHMTMSPFRLLFVLEPLDAITLGYCDKGLLFLHLICFIDVVAKFNIGYVDTKHSDIILDRTSIACRYISTWFVLDLVSCLPFTFTLLYMDIKEPRWILASHVLPLFRIGRIYTVTQNLDTFTKLFSRSYIVHGAVRIAVLMLLSVHWGACLMYAPPVAIYYWTGTMPLTYNYYLRKLGGRNLIEYTIDIRYCKAFIIVICAFFDTGFSMFKSNLADELLIHSFIILYADMFMIYTLVFFINSYLTVYNSTKRYIGLMNQVEEYMKYNQFPVSLKKRVRTFYEYEYQKHYFRKEKLKYLSEELYDEIRLHTSRVLIFKVELFKDIPARTVGTILGCLHSEIYLANDLVVAAGDIGDCMYFIATGTVAVYSLKGVEVCHLEDGAHFGEIALFMKDKKRVATVVAVETTKLYRLDVDNFRRYVMTQPMLYERIEILASRRMHETVLVDDAFRYERETHMSASSTQLMGLDDKYL